MSEQNQLDELAPDLSEWLDVERAAPALPDAHRDALWNKLEQALDAPPAAPPPEKPEAASRDVGAATNSLAGAALRMLPAGLVGAVAGAAMHAFITQPASTPSAPVTAPAATSAITVQVAMPTTTQTMAYATPPLPTAVASSASSLPPPRTVPVEAPSAAATSTAVPSPTSVTNTDERALIERGRAALARRDWLSALEAIRERDKSYPQGTLREERDALEVQALALAGRNEDARAKGTAFLKRYPGSVFTLKIEALERELSR